MDSNRYEKGIETLGTMISEEMMQATIENIRQFSPDMARLIVEFPFGSIYSRPGLDLRQRSLLTISSLVTQGAESQLHFHIHVALNVGLSPEQIVEAVMHCLPYAGFPKSLGALNVVMDVLKEREVLQDN